MLHHHLTFWPGQNVVLHYPLINLGKIDFPVSPTLTCSLPCTHQYLLYIDHHSPLQHQLKPSNNPQSSQFWISIFAF
jgi:hypothetical protein